MNTKARTVTGWVLAVLLGGLYVLIGAGKFFPAGNEMFATWGYAPWFAKLIGGLEVLGGVGLIVPRTTGWAILGLTAIMLGAVYTHVAHGEAGQVVRPGVFLVLLWVLGWLRRPRADATR